MDEVHDSITVLQAHDGEGRGWFLTQRPFERPKEKYSPEELQFIEERYGSWDNAKYQLGFRDSDIELWGQKNFRILEIGPGLGVSTEQLLDRGLDIYALEPSLRFNEKDDEQVAELKSQFSKPKFKGRISPAKAVDAAFAFPGKQFDVAFAIGPNFQTYSETDNELLAQISGVISALSQNDHSFFTFDINDDGTFPYGSQEIKFNLEQFLIDHTIRYTKIRYMGDYVEDTAIRIFRMNDQRQDARDIFDSAMREDTSKYSASNS